MIVKPATRSERPTFGISPHPVRGVAGDVRSEQIVTLAAEIRAADGSSDDNPILEITSTSGSEDRHGSTITSFAWDDATFMRTGHVLWQHDAVPAYPYVAKKLSSRMVGDKSVSTHQLLIGPWRHMNCNLPAFLWEAYRDFGMGAISRAFIPKHWNPRRATTIPSEFAENVEYDKVEQTEESYVNVPSNRDSFARAAERVRTAGKMTDHLARVLGFDTAPYEIRLDRQQENVMTLTPGATVRFIDNEATRANAPMVACGFETDGTVVAIDGERASVEFLNPHYSGMFAGVDAASLRVVAAAPNDWTVESYSGDARVISARASRDYHAEPPAKSVRARMASLRFGIRTAREALRDICYMDPCYVPMECCSVCGTPEAIGCDCGEQAPSDVAAIEQQTLSDLIDITSEQLATALAGWDGSQHSALRFHCSGLVYDCMWRIDRLLVMADFWYPDMTFGNPADVSTEEMRKYSAWAADPKNRSAIDGIMTRVGAEISTKNRSKIQGICDRAETVAEHATTIADQCREMLKATDAATSEDSADDARGNSGTMIRVLGSDSRGEGENEGHIRVFATDRTPAGGGAASTSRGQQLYDGDVLRPKK